MFSATGFILFGVSPTLDGDICQGDFICQLLFSIITYLPYFLALTVIVFIALTVLRKASSLGNKLKYSIVLSLILILLYHNFLSIWIEKQGVMNRYKQLLSQVDYELYEPTYMPDGHKLFESRVDYGHLSLYYTGDVTEQFIISEFKKPQVIDLTPPDCQIGGFSGENDDFEVIDDSGFSSWVHGSCQEIKTPKGNSVYLMTFNITSEKKLAATILGNTLITISGFHFPNQELMNLIDGLEEKSALEINLKVDNRTIGR